MKDIFRIFYLDRLVNLIVRLYYSIVNDNIKLERGVRIKKCIFGKYNKVYSNVYIYNSKIGDFTYIAANTTITNASIGKFCSIGQNVQISLSKHPVDGFVSTPPAFFSTGKQCGITFSDKNYFKETENVRIGHDVWIGNNAIIMSGVTIGNGAIIAAGSIVTKNIEEYSIVAGVPARHLKYRFNENIIYEILKSEWWNFDIKYLKNNFKYFHDIEQFIGKLDQNDYK